MKALQHALRETINGQVKALFIVVVGGAIGLGYLYFDQGREEVIAEIPFWEAAILGALGALLLLFLWNLAWAPFQMKRKAQRLEAQRKTEREKPKKEKGGGPNGTYTRDPSGSQYCRGAISIEPKEIKGTFTVTFPAAFSEPPSISVVPEGVLSIENVDTVGADFKIETGVWTGQKEPIEIHYTAIGRWD
ncbi:MAG: hypothetical protein AAF382_10630 [Pseudomonadota bacterium]